MRDIDSAVPMLFYRRENILAISNTRDDGQVSLVAHKKTKAFMLY